MRSYVVGTVNEYSNDVPHNRSVSHTHSGHGLADMGASPKRVRLKAPSGQSKVHVIDKHLDDIQSILPDRGWMEDEGRQKAVEQKGKTE